MTDETLAAMPCEQCGQSHLTRHGKPSCPGHITSGERKGLACRQDLGQGTNHVGIGCCKKHGGATQSHVRHAQNERLDIEVRKQLGLTQWTPISDPYSALADLAGEVWALKDILRAKVEELETLRQYGGEYGEQIDIIFAAYERGIDRAEKILAGMARLDLDAKIAKLHAMVNDETAAIVRKALDGALATIELTAAQRESVLVEFGARLRTGKPAIS